MRVPFIAIDRSIVRGRTLCFGSRTARGSGGGCVRGTRKAGEVPASSHACFLLHARSIDEGIADARDGWKGTARAAAAA